MIDSYFLIPVVNAQVFNSKAELTIPTETSTNEANAEIENLESNLKSCTLLYGFHF